MPQNGFDLVEEQAKGRDLGGVFSLVAFDSSGGGSEPSGASPAAESFRVSHWPLVLSLCV
jgi:hypothetical protein